MSLKWSTSTFNEHLTCPVCFEIIQDATLLKCGHTFCRQCLVECDEQDNGPNCISCPLCRQDTRLGPERVYGLPKNVLINGLVDDIRNPKDQDSEAKKNQTCFRHNEKNMLFCKDCHVHICLQCLMRNHLNHQMITAEEFAQEMHRKVEDVVDRSTALIDAENEVIGSLEDKRQEGKSHLLYLKDKIIDILEQKSEYLTDAKADLLEKIDLLEINLNEKFDYAMVPHRSLVGSLYQAMSVVQNPRLEFLGGDELTAHDLVCTDLRNLLEKKLVVDQTTEGVLANILQIQFTPAADESLSLGDLNQTKEVGVLRIVKLENIVECMTPLTTEGVLVGFGTWVEGAETFFVENEDEGADEARLAGHVWGIAELSGDRTAVSRGTDSVKIFENESGLWDGEDYLCEQAGDFTCQLCSDVHDALYVVNGNPHINVLQTGNVGLRYTIPTGNVRVRQVCLTSSGILIASSCDITPSTVGVFDRGGRHGGTIHATFKDEFLYAAVDSRDRLYIGRVRQGSDALRISAYSVEGIELHELPITFQEIKLSLEVNIALGSSCFMACLPRNILAFAHYHHLYFFELPA